jgi:hypothetical protein
MIWLTWRQHRAQAATALGFVALFSAFLVVQGRTVHDAFTNTGLAACLDGDGQCTELLNAFGTRFSSLQLLIPLVLVLPLLIGLFWGAPLVAREAEHGTHRLVWAQGVSRARWLLTKTGLLGVAAAVVASVFTAVGTWFSGPFNRTSTSRLAPGVFDLQGVVPVAYTLFAVALGVAVGAWVRRVLPAMAITLAGYVGVRAFVTAVARPRFLDTRQHTYDTLAGNPRTGMGDFVLGGQILDSQGRVFSDSVDLTVTPATAADFCPSLVTGPGAFPSPGSLSGCLEQLGLRTFETYRPASQFWTMQAIETVLFLVAAAACVALAIRFVRGRVS